TALSAVQDDLPPGSVSFFPSRNAYGRSFRQPLLYDRFKRSRHKTLLHVRQAEVDLSRQTAVLHLPELEFDDIVARPGLGLRQRFRIRFPAHMDMRNGLDLRVLLVQYLQGL